jgi:hypothetical protein
MKTSPTLRWSVFLLMGFGAGLFCRSSVHAEEFEAVFSKTSNGYVRTRLADGSFQSETYTLLKGGFLGGDIPDPTIEQTSFDDIAQKTATALARQNYVPSRDRKAIELLIVVFWGTTVAPDYHDPFPSISVPEPGEKVDLPVLSERSRLPNDEVRKDTERIKQTADLLGYASLSDPELLSRRYFVVVLAYDFQLKLTRGISKLLWETRFSIRERGNAFGEQLAAMVGNASHYYGQDSRGLIHDPVPKGRVEIGEIKSLGVVPDAELGHAALAPDGDHVAYFRMVRHTLKLVIVDVDQPLPPAFFGIPASSLGPRPLTWADAEHVIVPQSSAGSLSFNLVGKRSQPDGKTHASTPADDARSGATDPSLAEIQTLADGKLPDRKVVILGADEARHRFLLLVSGGAGSTRYFVFDRPNDLLFEVGREQPIP